MLDALKCGMRHGSEEFPGLWCDVRPDFLAEFIFDYMYVGLNLYVGLNAPALHCGGTDPQRNQLFQNIWPDTRSIRLFSDTHQGLG